MRWGVSRTETPTVDAAGVKARFWHLTPEELFAQLNCSGEGLTSAEAAHRLELGASRNVRARGPHAKLKVLLSQFESPIVLILLGAAGLSAALGQQSDALIILTIVVGSGLIGFWQERGARDAVEALLARVRITAAVIRDRSEIEVPADEVVPGDILVLNAGDIIPADCRILESKDLHVDEAALTGETFPAEKIPGVLAEATSLGARTNALFMGTHALSGTARAVVVLSGCDTELGRISGRIGTVRPEAEFERGIRRFGYLLMEFTLLLVLAIFAVNVALSRPILEALLFSTALAVGLTPQLLPAIIGVNLAHGARQMAARKVIVKRLASIESFGSMDVLCSDKTGTLTEGVVRLHDALDVAGEPSDKVLLYAFLNASLEAGFTNPIDEAIRTHRVFDISGYRKLGEVPYDFIRKRLSVAVAKGEQNLLVTKGALLNVLAVCSRAESKGGVLVELSSVRPAIEARYAELGAGGFRVLGVACRDFGTESSPAREHETDMTFLGFIVLYDPPKPAINATIADLGRLGIALKILTGDNRLVAATVARMVGFDSGDVLSGPEIEQMSDDALIRQAQTTKIFAEVEPNQKERILLALKKAGNVVGYIGDGINDASALHAADVGISVESAVDVAKEAADIVLLEKDLGVLVEGVRFGRVALANTLKYVYMATSANFGNMVSMAGLSAFIPFLPLLPKQILLMNLLTDFPEMAIATDGVDEELIERPRRWDVRDIRNFMLVFGAVSSLFDFVTFGVLLVALHASPEEFRTGWFMESVISASVIVLVIRTRRPFFASRPGRGLLLSTIVIGCVTLALPYMSVSTVLGFHPLPPIFLLAMGAIVASYIIAAELTKRVFFRTLSSSSSGHAVRVPWKRSC